MFFFVQHPSYYNLFYRLDFGIYGNFYQFFQNGLIYYQQSAVPNFVLGDVTTCPLLVQLNTSIYNKSLPFPNTVRAQLKQFYLAVYQSFETVTTLEGRFEFINAKFGEFCGLQPAYFGWFEYVKFGIFGRFTQIVEYWATRHICGGHFPWDGKPGSGSTTLVPTTPEAVITSTETAGSTATSPEATTTPTGTTSEEVTVSTTVVLSSTASSEASTTQSVEFSTSSTTDVTTDETTSGTSDSPSSSSTTDATSESTEITSTTETSTESTSFETPSITTDAITDVTSESSSDVNKYTTLIPSSSTQCTCTCV
uniref:Hyphal_reg_CWP domain-containing protein n=1 Tax=Panagrellus redivivus TaxID=6233 RepID=A0A7E4VMZ6_PANRE